MTLHEAIQIVLFEANKALTSKEIAITINEQKLYYRNDNLLIPSSQITARVSHYPDTFKTNSDNSISLAFIDILEILRLKNGLLLDYLKRIKNSNPLILPLLYFFKRIIDNPIHFKFLNQNLGNKPKCELNGFMLFLSGLNQSDTIFDSLFNQIISDIKTIENEKHVFQALFDTLKKIELNENNVSKDQFNRFYSSILNLNFNDAHKGSEYSTPVEIIDIISKIADLSSARMVYNPFAGPCSLAIKVLSTLTSEYSFYGEELNYQIYFKGLLNLTLNGVDASNFSNSNSFNQTHKSFADLCISNPPFAGFLQNKIKPGYHIDHILPGSFIIKGVQLIIDSLNPVGGRAIIIVPENLLFLTNSIYIEFRKELIAKNLIESIISLPSATDGPFANTKTNLLVLNKSKQSQSIIFFDLPKFESVYKAHKQDNSQYIMVFANYYRDLVSNIYYPVLNPIDQLFVNVVTLKKSENNLAVSRQIREQGFELKNDNIKKLKDICVFVNNKSLKHSESYSYIRISDLNKNYYDFKLNTTKLYPKIAKGKIIAENTFLVGNIAGSFKPTFFEFKNDPIVLSNDVYAFSIKNKFKSITNPEFLIYELSSDYILNQIESFAIGATSLRRIAKADFMNIKIKIPSLDEQLNILKNKKDALLAAKVVETQEFAESLDITHLNEREILEFVNHEFGNINGAIVIDLDNLKSFIKRKSKNLEILSLDTKITTRTVGEIIDGLAGKFENITSIMSTIQNILQSTKASLKLEPVKIKDFIKQQVRLLDDYSKDFHVEYSGQELIDTKDILVKLDKNQFALVLRNFIINSYKHGYDDNKKNWKNLIFDVSEDADNVYIDMINDGKQFEKDFSLSDFIGFGIRRSATKGSGLGGYLMNKVIENHAGKLELMEPSSMMVISNPIEDSHSPDQRLIIPGVHFKITLPKNVI